MHSEQVLEQLNRWGISGVTQFFESYAELNKDLENFDFWNEPKQELWKKMNSFVPEVFALLPGYIVLQVPKTARLNQTLVISVFNLPSGVKLYYQCFLSGKPIIGPSSEAERQDNKSDIFFYICHQLEKGDYRILFCQLIFGWCAVIWR